MTCLFDCEVTPVLGLDTILEEFVWLTVFKFVKPFTLVISYYLVEVSFGLFAAIFWLVIVDYLLSVFVFLRIWVGSGDPIFLLVTFSYYAISYFVWIVLGYGILLPNVANFD